MKMAKLLIAMLTTIIMVSLGFQSPMEAEAASQYKIEVNKRTNYLYLYKNNKVVGTYRVATGKPSSPTPEGTFAIVTRFKCPQWKTVPGCTKENPLGKYFMGLKVSANDAGRTYGIHGNNDSKSIGKSVSSGCVRMYNTSVEKLFNKVPIGTLVWIHSGTSNKKWRGKSKAQYGTSIPKPTNNKLDSAKAK
jgi:lipoprotein-anchoring transpeptidase ErfK/SrfK